MPVVGRPHKLSEIPARRLSHDCPNHRLSPSVLTVRISPATLTRSLAVVLAMLLAACGSGDKASEQNLNNQGTQTTNPESDSSAATDNNSTDFAIESLPLDLAVDPWNWPANANGWPARDFPPVHIFGREYQGHVEATLMFDLLKVDSPVLAPITGKVMDVRAQPESCDVELYIGSDTYGQTVSLDHISTTLKRGDMVRAGEVVGSVPPWQCKEGFGRFELMYVQDKDGTIKAYCPMNFLANSIRDATIAAIKDVMVRWNKIAGSATSAYSDEDLAHGICQTDTADS